MREEVRARWYRHETKRGRLRWCGNSEWHEEGETTLWIWDDEETRDDDKTERWEMRQPWIRDAVEEGMRKKMKQELKSDTLRKRGIRRNRETEVEEGIPKMWEVKLGWRKTGVRTAETEREQKKGRWSMDEDEMMEHWWKKLCKEEGMLMKLRTRWQIRTTKEGEKITWGEEGKTEGREWDGQIKKEMKTDI